ncbi:Ig-like domain-containing protein (plasmid) [Pseudomonas mandelii]|uniref:Ig-like domain-containing protein n=1 Tax=Pseudomonas mandelii TaxID=75612 RepID=UPI00398D10FD
MSKVTLACMRYTFCLLAALALSFTSLCARAYIWDGIVYPQTPGATISTAAQVPLDYTNIVATLTFPSRVGNSCTASGMGSHPAIAAYLLWRPKGSTGLFTVANPIVDGTIFGFISCGGASRTASASIIKGNTIGGPTEPGEYEFAAVVTWQLCNNCQTIDDYTNVVTVSVGVTNTPPTAGNASLVTAEDTVGAVGLPIYDPDAGDYHSFQILGGPSVGSAWLSGNVLYYSPPANWSGSTSVTYRAVDSKGAPSNAATVYITVNPVNDPPMADAKVLTLNEDSSGSVQLSGNDIDSPAPTVFQIVAAPPTIHGSATIAGSVLTFTGYKDWNGQTNLTYRAQDNQGAWSLPALVQVTVKPINDVPVLRAPLKIETRESQPVTVKGVITKQ